MADGFDIYGSVKAGQSLVAPIAEFMERLRQKETDIAKSDQIVRFALQSKQIGPEQYDEYLNLNPEKKKGFVGGLLITHAQQLEQQEQARREQEAQLRQRIDQQHVLQRMADNDFRERDLQQRYQLATMRGAPKADSLEALNKQVRAVSGSDLGDWQNATNKREENGYIIAEISKPNPMASIPGMEGIAAPEIKKTLRMPKPLFDQSVRRFNALTGAGDESAPAPPGRIDNSAPPGAGARIGTKQEYDALPSGTVFVAPDGSTRKKP